MNDDRADLHLDRTPTGRLDEALPGPSVTPLSRLHNYRISEGDPDVRGWEVFGADGRQIGTVDDLLVDTEGLRVRYLDVNLDSSLFGGEGGTRPEGLDTHAPQVENDAVSTGLPPFGTPLSATGAMGGLGPMVTETLVRSTLSDEENQLTQDRHRGFGTRHVLIPIGNARLDPDHDRILVQGLSAAMASGLPDYTGEDLDHGYETGLRGRFDSSYTPAPDRRDFYAHDLYDQDRFYGPRRGRTDTARAAGLEPGGSTAPDRPITGELDRAVNAPSHDQTREEAEAVLPGRGRS